MTIEEKKAYLKRYRKAYLKAQALEEELNNIRINALPGGIDYSKDKIQTTPTNDQMVNYIIQVEQLEEKIRTIKRDSIDICTAILNVISTIDNDTYQTVLHRRYILMQTWEEIACAMHYSTQRLYELHCEALAELNIIDIREKQSKQL